MNERNVFISYAGRDKQWAEWLGERLGRHGFGIWTDATSVPVGESFMAELKRTIEKSGRAGASVAELFPIDMVSAGNRRRRGR